MFGYLMKTFGLHEKLGDGCYCLFLYFFVCFLVGWFFIHRYLLLFIYFIIIILITPTFKT